MAEKFIFSYINQDREGIFRDMAATAGRQHQIEFLPSHKILSAGPVGFIEKAALSYRLNRVVSGDFFGVWGNLEQYPYQADDIYHIVIPTTSIAKFSLHYLLRFRGRHTNVKLYALVTDSMHAESPHMQLVRRKLFSPVWEKVLTYDKYDAKEYGFTWFGYTYYSSFDFVSQDSRRADLYYSGYNKGNREMLVLDVLKSGKNAGAECRFDVVSDKPGAGGDLVYLKNRISYPEVVSRVKASNCILEILQEGQQAQSIRYFEAIVYNKKLLTNNCHLEELPFYNSHFMRCFRDASEIDWNWVKKPEDIDYQYDGSFSPVYLKKFVTGEL